MVLANENINLPTKTVVNKKLGEINKLIHHHFTDAEITEKMRRTKALIDMVERADERREIEERKRVAKSNGDLEAVQACEDELKALVPMKLACNSTLHPNRTEPINSPNKKREADRLAEINRRNQQINTETIRKAQLEESRVRRVRAPAPAAAATVDGKSTTDDGLLKPKLPISLDDDLFGSDRSRGATPLAGTPNRISTPDLVSSVPVVKTASGEKAKKSGFGLLKKKQRDDDVLANMDLGIEIEI